MGMPTLGVSFIVHDEERQLARALASVAGLADDLVVVDCESADRSAAVAAGTPGVRLFRRPNDPNLNRNKSFGIEQLTTDWVLYLDPDEWVPEPLAAEIRQTIATPGESVAFRMPRLNRWFGRDLHHGGQYPDLQLRLFRAGKARFPNRHVHESLSVDGPVGRLRHPLGHEPYPDLATWLRKLEFYTRFQADFWRRELGRPNWRLHAVHFAVRPTSRFIRRYLLKRGFLDGWQGLIAAVGDAFGGMFSYARFLELAARELPPA